VHIRNKTDVTQKGRVVFTFPGPSPQEVVGSYVFKHRKVEGNFSGVEVTHESGVGYALGVVGEEIISSGGDLGVDMGAWSRIGETYIYPGPSVVELPAEVGQAGASVSVSFELNAEDEKIIRFILAWYSPEWKGEGRPLSGGNTYVHMYASRFNTALEVAQLLAEQHQSLLERILRWQQVIYSERNLPLWLRESLVNILHLITEDGLWAQARPPIGAWCRPEDGVFGMSESPRACPQIECIPCSFYGNLPLVYFFPELALSALRAYKAYQFPDGQVPWVFGGCTARERTPPCEMATPSRGYSNKPQTTLDGPCYVDMVDRFWLCTGNSETLKEFYHSIKNNVIFTMNLRPEAGPAGIVSLPSGNNGQDWFESVDLYGIVPHIGGVHLASLRMAERMAKAVGDKNFAQQCRNWFNEGSEVMEGQTWTGDYYLLYYEPETQKRSDVIMGYQLDGEWMAKSHGLQSVFIPDRVKKVLATFKKEIITDRGAIVFKAKGGEFNPGYWTASGIHIPGTLMLAMTYMYYGETDFGLELARRAMRTLVIENRCSWDSAILFRSDTGERIYGNDYYQNMVLWFLPAAICGQDLAGPCKPGGLVDRVIQAGKRI
jgi:uncharacterized protein (DUF608 family)